LNTRAAFCWLDNGHERHQVMYVRRVQPQQLACELIRLQLMALLTAVQWHCLQQCHMSIFSALTLLVWWQERPVKSSVSKHI